MPRHDKSGPLLATVALLLIYIFYSHTSRTEIPETQYPSNRGVQSSFGSSQRVDHGSKMVIITMNNRETSYDILSLGNKFAYANTQGYDIQVDYDGSGPWHKLTMIEEKIKEQKYDWIWWMDFDTLITNKSIRITDIVEETLKKHKDPKNVDMLFTPDCWPMNTGSMLYRGRDLELLDFLQFIRKCGKENESFSEQDCIRDAVGVQNDPKEHPVVSPKWSKKWAYIQQHRINAFPDEIGCVEQGSRQWQKGDFVIHFAGAWAHVKEEDPTGFLMRKYQGAIVG